MTVEQEKDVLEKCIKLARDLTGKHPVGYRAPLYQIRASTIRLLQENGFLYDSSLNAHDSIPYRSFQFQLDGRCQDYGCIHPRIRI